MLEISVIIPTHKRPEKLSQCLNSLLAQDFDMTLAEIIVVDDEGSLLTKKMVLDLAKKGFALRYCSSPQTGPAAARNQGIKMSAGQIIAFIDDDCVADKHWLKLMVQGHKKHLNCAAIGGNTFVPGKAIAEQIGQFLSDCSIECLVDQKKEVIFFPTCNVSLKRKVFLDVMFDQEFLYPGGEDLELFWRVFKQGKRFIWDKRIIVEHRRPVGLRKFIQQAYSYGRGNFLVKHLHPDHPLLKEVKTGSFSFWKATLINFLKIPRFSFVLGKRLIASKKEYNFLDRLTVYLLFGLHKIVYLIGNVFQYLECLGPKKKTIKTNIPRSLILDITHKCNLKCRICDIWKTQNKEQDISLEIVKKMLKQASNQGVSEITLSGGEPLLRDDIFEILEFGRSLQLKKISVLTNGIIVSRLFTRLKPYLLDQTITLVFSLDSLEDDVYRKTRGGQSSLEDLIKSLRLVSSLKKENPQVNFYIITIILGQNLGQLKKITEFAQTLGANGMHFQSLLANNLEMAKRAESEFWVGPQQLELLDKTIDQLQKLKQQNPEFIRNSLSNLEKVKKYFRNQLTEQDISCNSGAKTVLVSNQGTYTTCFTVYGDVFKDEFDQVLKSKKRLIANQIAKKCKKPCLLPCFCEDEDEN